MIPNSRHSEVWSTAVPNRVIVFTRDYCNEKARMVCKGQKLSAYTLPTEGNSLHENDRALFHSLFLIWKEVWVLRCDGQLLDRWN